MKLKTLLVPLSLILVLLLVGACAPAPPSPTKPAAPAQTPSPTTPSPSPAAPAPKVNITFTNYTTETHDTSTAWKFFMSKVNELTKGAVNFKSYYGGALGGAKEVLPFCTAGTVDIACFKPTNYPGMFKLTRVAELAYTGFKMDARQQAFMEMMKLYPEANDEYKAQNVKLLIPAMSSAPILASKKTIQKIEDFKGMKFYGSGYDEICLKSWGATPVTMEPGDIYDAISKGVLDGAGGLPAQTMVVYNLQEIAKNFIEPGIGPSSTLAFAMNLNSYNNLPPDVRKAFDEAAELTSSNYAQIRMEGERKAMPKVIEANVRVYALAPDVMAQMETLAKKNVFDKWVSEMTAAGASEAKARELIDKYIQLYKKFEPTSKFKGFVDLYNEVKK